MKKIALLLLLTLSCFTLRAQITEGHLIYDMKYTAPDEHSEVATNSMLEGSTLEMWFAKDYSRVILNTGTIMSIDTRVDLKKEKTLMLISSFIMDKMAVTTTFKELNSENPQEQKAAEVTLLPETKKILGYTCKKAKTVTEDGVEVIFWYTDKIKANMEQQQNFNKDIPGLPLEIQTETNNITITITATQFDKSIPNKQEVFNLTPPEGYQIKSYEEFKNLMSPPKP